MRHEEIAHGLPPLHHDRICEECFKFSPETFECKKWLKTKNREDNACTYFAPVQRTVSSILQILATKKGSIRALEEFHDELRGIVRKSGYKIRTEAHKGFRSFEILNPDQIFGEKLIRFVKEWEKSVHIEIKCKTERKSVARSL